MANRHGRRNGTASRHLQMHPLAHTRAAAGVPRRGDPRCQDQRALPRRANLWAMRPKRLKLKNASSFGGNYEQRRLTRWPGGARRGGCWRSHGSLSSSVESEAASPTQLATDALEAPSCIRSRATARWTCWICNLPALRPNVRGEAGPTAKRRARRKDDTHNLEPGPVLCRWASPRPRG